MPFGLSVITPRPRGTGLPVGRSDATGKVYTVSGLKAGSTAILYANGAQIGSTTVAANGTATWTLGTAPTPNAVMTYEGTVTGSAGVAPGVSTTPPLLALRGVSIAGGEFGSNVPGTMGQDYYYPSNEKIDYFLATGVTALRVPFLWERLLPTMGGEFSSADIAEMDRVISRITNGGANVILDMHNYARRTVSGALKVIGESGSGVTAAQLGAGWAKIADRYKANNKVVIELMNEPYNMDGAGWVATQNTAVAAIRQAGFTGLVLVTGIAYSGAHSWVSSGNANFLLQAVDPGNNMGFVAHQYFDADSSGFYQNSGSSSASCTVGAGASRCAPFTNWLKTNGKKGMITEYGAPGDTQCLTELKGFYDHLTANSDVYLGAQGWAAFGQPDYVINLDPPVNRMSADAPIYTLLRRYLLGLSKPLAVVSYIQATGTSGSSFPAGSQIYGVGGLPGYTYDIASGSLPGGLTIDPVTGKIPAATISGSGGTFTFVPRVTDAQGNVALGDSQTITVAAAAAGVFDTADVQHFGYTNRAAINHTFTGTNRYALVAVYSRDLASVTGVTVGGQAATLIRSSSNPNVAGVAVYGLVAPPTGNQEVVVALADYKLVSVVVQGVAGVAQTGSIDASAVNAGISNAVSTALTTATAGAFLWDAVETKSGAELPLTATVGAGQTVVTNGDHPDANAGLALASKRTAGAPGAQSLVWTLSASDDWRSVAVALKPAA